MGGKFDKLVNDIAGIVTNPKTSNKPSGYDTTAEVKRVDGDTAWVKIPGGVDETPVRLTINAKQGDTVQLRVSGGTAWIVGNETAPPTDDSAANKAIQKTNQVELLAKSAKKSADDAQETADEATAKIETIDGQITALVTDVEGNSASITQQATQIESLVSDVESNTSSITQQATQIQSMVSDIEENSTTITQTSKDLTIEINNAKQAADDAESDAEEAKTAANDAKTAAASAQSTANSARSTASSAYSEANEAAKTATNYIRADSSGVHVFLDNENYSTVGSDGFYVTKDGTIVARFTGSIIELGQVLHISKSSHNGNTALISTYQGGDSSNIIPLNILATSVSFSSDDVYLGSINSHYTGNKVATKSDLENIPTTNLTRKLSGSGNIIIGEDITGGNAATTGWVSDNFVKRSDGDSDNTVAEIKAWAKKTFKLK